MTFDLLILHMFMIALGVGSIVLSVLIKKYEISVDNYDHPYASIMLHIAFLIVFGKFIMVAATISRYHVFARTSSMFNSQYQVYVPSQEELDLPITVYRNRAIERGRNDVLGKPTNLSRDYQDINRVDRYSQPRIEQPYNQRVQDAPGQLMPPITNNGTLTIFNSRPTNTYR